MDDETAVMLQSLSRFNDGPDGRAVDLRWQAKTRFHLRQYGSRNLAETTLVVIEAELQVIIKHHNRSHSQNSVGLYVTW